MELLTRETVEKERSEWPEPPPVRPSAMEAVVCALGDTSQTLRRREAQIRTLTKLLLHYGRPKYSCFRGVLTVPCPCVVCTTVDTVMKELK